MIGIRGRADCRSYRIRPTAGRDRLDVLANKIGGQFRKASVIALRIAVLDCKVAALDVAGLFQPGAKSAI